MKVSRKGDRYSYDYLSIINFLEDESTTSRDKEFLKEKAMRYASNDFEKKSEAIADLGKFFKDRGLAHTNNPNGVSLKWVVNEIMRAC